ncbi:alkaline phosphatase family protein [Calothrix rhizosoleniae]|uniref:alkaline phosphatase family protein n=1 Tax=Calothrix rhizosoleniae TaxID=888997 RepID=UPI000B4A3D57|nr:alkaline phosphatase family protein [Calothrix rhizosoleniae]
MSKLFVTAEEKLLTQQALPETFGFEAIRPSYDGLGLGNITALASHWLCPGAPILSKQSPLPLFNPPLLGTKVVTEAWNNWLSQGAINHVVLLIADGLGYDQLKSLMNSKDVPSLTSACHSSQAFFMPATSVYPSTTVTALTSAATAYAPAQHGMIGTNLYLRELGSIVNFIGFCPTIAPTHTPYLDSQLDPDNLIPVPNQYLLMEKAGIDVGIINLQYFKQTSISRFTTASSQAGTTGFRGYLTPADGFSQLRQRLEKIENQGKSFTFMYIPNLDSSAHRYGPLSPSYRAEIGALDFAIQRELLEPLTGRKDVVLLFTADHGQRPTFAEKTLWLNDHPTLTQMLFTPAITGESRSRFLHLQHGMETAAINYIETHLQEQFTVITKQQAIASGLLGLPNEALGRECGDRLGDLILLPRYDWVCRHQVTSEEKHSSLAGIHGGLSRPEMLIPFLAYRF